MNIATIWIQTKISRIMNIPQGYKQTELGIIPEDWEVTTIKQIADITTGNKNTQDAEEGGKYPFYVRSQNVERINSYSYDCEGVVTAGDGVGTGKIFHYVRGKFGLHQRAYLIYNFKDFDSQYFYWYFSQYFYDRINQMTAKSSVDSVRKEMIEDMCILRAPIAEQRAIAEALSDVDGLIAALDKKIAKKRLLKQGAMQQLLTGKKRLPGFTDKWVEFTFGDYVDIYRGGSPRPIESYITDSPNGVNWIKIGDVKPNDKYINKTEERIIPDGVSRSRRVDVGDFILSNSMSFGRPYILGIDGCIHDGWLVIQNYHNSFDKDYLYYLLCSEDVMMQYIGMAAGSSVKNLNKEKVASLQLCVPTTIEEQQAIATILSDMDKEIADLEAQRDKYCLLKSGMMQKLLTGQIRLKTE